MLLGYSNVLGSGTGEPHLCYALVSPRPGACACFFLPLKEMLFFSFLSAHFLLAVVSGAAQKS